MRLFIAVDLPEQAKDYISQIAEQIKAIPGVKPVSKENIHITMKFLGEVEESKVSGIIDAISNVKFEKFNLTLGELGVFPDEKEIQVIWVSAEPEKALIDIRKKIDKALPEFKADHHFKSHITFARVKNVLNDADRKKIIELLKKQTEKIEFSVEKLYLCKSTLTPKGPVYEVVKEF